ncbi:hypothetical protein [Paraburkholderia caribensis]|uniref:hypothetical protein n=1 Tax=Paraburkholderia caribensis TaxID=75105 RepID=UPI001CB3B7EB|nr:hypothetical protein [Paraburkholderia caribensis]CAG9244932.1 conserved hypothetical protein [Paraburkholderia caribensis]
MSDAQALKAYVEHQIEKELARCRKKHGPENWALHGEWVTAYVVAGAKEWLERQASEGKL